MKEKIAVIFGGEGLESDISINSAENIISSLDKKLYTPLPIFIDNAGIWRICEPRQARRGGCEFPEAYPVNMDMESGFLVLGKVIPVELAIVAMHGNLGEDGIIQGALESAKIRILGQSVLACALTNDKISTKAIADKLKIKTARWVFLFESNSSDALTALKEHLTFPVFLKASSFGSSHGAFKVSSEDEFLISYQKIRELGEKRILAEEYVDIDYELECAFVDYGKEHFFPCGIIQSQGRFYSFEEKYKRDSAFKAHLGSVPSSIEKKAIEYSKALKNEIGIRYIARFDYFVKGEDLIFNEINCFPGMTPTSLYPKIIEEKLFSLTECLTRLINYRNAGNI